MGIEDTPRFDQYSVRPAKNGTLHVVQLMKDVSFVLAAILAGISQEDFEQSVIHTGWVGTCPRWLGMPVITVPRGELLSVDHLDFMVEVIES